MELSRKIEIKFNWWTDEVTTEDVLTYDEIDILEGEAQHRIIEMIKKGYTSGELHTEINGITYQGWWDFNYV